MSVYVVKCRGGFADGHFLVRVGALPRRVLVTEREGEQSQMYLYVGGEEQMRDVVKYEGRVATRVKVVEAVYHIFRPAPEAENLDGV
jgi:hypothetical protein